MAPKQYVITVDIDANESTDPAMLSADIVNKVTECALAIDGVTAARVVGVA